MAEVPIGSAILALARAQRNYLNRRLAAHGIHPGQDQLLVAVWNSPGMRQNDLARELGVEPPTVTRMVMRLERSGLVERRDDPGDARATLVIPTQRSRLLEPHVRMIWQEMEAQLSGSIPSGLSAAMEGSMAAMRRALETDPPAEEAAHS